MKVIFLDFDGVLNSWPYLESADRLENRMPMHAHALDPKNVERLNVIVAETGAVVVVSSSWRHAHSVENLQWILKARGFKGQVVDKTADSIGPDMERGDEIRAWLNEHPEVTVFIVLDDDSDMTAVRSRHIKTNIHNGGLLDKHVDLAIRLLAGD